MIAQMALRSGDLLMCTPPLALVEQQDDTGPTPQVRAGTDDASFALQHVLHLHRAHSGSQVAKLA